MADKEKQSPSQSRRGSPADTLNPNDSGVFRWYQDLLDRILPKKPGSPKQP
ncbi:MAG TPA: hypothetical protein VMZ25_04715 [Terriglobales bacterium]|nr:hypothetical protein [Terriglobales bacterium]